MSKLEDVESRRPDEAAIREWLKVEAERAVKSKSVLEYLHEVFHVVEDRDDFVDRLEMNAKDYSVMRRCCSHVFDAETDAVVLRTGLMGKLWTADVHVGRCFDEPRAWGRRELPPEMTLWIRRGWEEPG